MRARPVSCSFTGHRPEKLPWGDKEADPRCAELKKRIAAAIGAAYEQGFRHFLCGMAQGCDLWFCEAALRLRKTHPDVSVEAVIPYPGQADRWPLAQRQRYLDLLEQCDFKTVVQKEYSLGCMQRRNRYLIDHSSLLIAVNDGLPGGTQKTILYAIRRQLEIVDISPGDFT